MIVWDTGTYENLTADDGDDGADARRNPTGTEPESVVSGRTVDEVGRDEP